MDEQKRPKPEIRQLSLIPCDFDKPIPKDLVMSLGMKAWIADVILEYFISHLCSSAGPSRCTSPIGYLFISVGSVHISVLILVSSYLPSLTRVTVHAEYGLRLAIESVARDEAQQCGYPPESESTLLE